MSNYEVDYELLALFDDVSALSYFEDNSIDEAYLSFLNEAPSTPDDRPERKMEDGLVQITEPTKTDRKKADDMFAVPKVYTCMYCFKRFYSRSVSRRHQVCHAKQQLRCPCCKTRSYNISILRRHYEYFHSYSRNRQVLIRSQ